MSREPAETVPPMGHHVFNHNRVVHMSATFLLAVRWSRAEARSPSIRGDDRHTPAAVMRRTWEARRSICIDGPRRNPEVSRAARTSGGTRETRACYPIVGVSRAPSGMTPCST
jgi:hypothetical protein